MGTPVDSLIDFLDNDDKGSQYIWFNEKRINDSVNTFTRLSLLNCYSANSEDDLKKVLHDLQSGLESKEYKKFAEDLTK